MKKGQASVEYLLILAFAFLILIPGSYLIYTFSQGSQGQLSATRINKAGNMVVDKAEEMYAVGQNSWTTLSITFPENTKNMYVEGNKELVVEYETTNGLSQAVFFSSVDLTTPYGEGNVSDNFQPGYTEIKIKAEGNEVKLEDVT